MPRVYGRGIKMRKSWVSLFNEQRCNNLRWPTLCDTSPSQFQFLRSIVCLLACMDSVLKYRDLQISMFGNVILTFSVCCTQTWLPKFAVFGYNMKASITLYQNQGAVSQSFSQSHLKHKHKYKEQSKAHCQFCYGVYGVKWWNPLGEKQK